MFVLTQLPTFPQLLNSSPGKAIRACAPKVLSEPGPQLVCSGLDRVWSWWLLGCLGGLEGEAQYYPVTSGRPLTGSHYFFIIMRKYAYRRRGYRGHKPSYTVNRKFCRNLTWNKLANDADIYTAAVQLVYNPSVESSNQLGTILLQLSTQKCTATRLTYYGLNQDTNIVGHGSAGWLDMCVCSMKALQTNLLS